MSTPIQTSPIDFNDWSAYSTFLGHGYSGIDLQNDQGFDHHGFFFNAGVGINLRFLDNRLKFAPRAVYEFSQISKDLGGGIESDAIVSAGGFEHLVSYAIVPTWLSLGALAGLGAAYYSSHNPGGAKTGGAEFNKNASTLPLDDHALRLATGVNLCVWNDVFCVNGKFSYDANLDPEMQLIDGGSSQMDLSPKGVSVGATWDIISIVDRPTRRRQIIPDRYLP